MDDWFSGIAAIRSGIRTKRISSWDAAGKNTDRILMSPGESRTLAKIEGPGKITHIWMTHANDDPAVLRKMLIKIYWDGEEHPSVLVPMGDFFCLGHSIVNSFQNIFVSASTNRNNMFTGRVALNAYFPMPFRQSARIEVVNETDRDHIQYYYIDYELYDRPFADETGYFHACFRRENPTPGWGHEITVNTRPARSVSNLSDKDNYLVLEAEGEGHLIGYNLSVTNLQTRLMNPFERTWWGEGDDMIFIDGEPWPPSIHGTGSEDAFHQAFAMQPNAYLYHGSSIWEKHTNGYQTSYVFYPVSPIRFTRSIRLSIEHGHANHLANDYSSVAYWYQKEPHRAFGIVNTRQRLPLVPSFSFPEGSRTDGRTIALNEEMKAAKQDWAEHFAARKEEGTY